MATLVEAVGGYVRSIYCGLLATNDYVNGGLGLISPGLREIARDIYNAQRRLAGCDPAGDTIPIEPPFEGGQCGDFYVVGIRVIGNFDGGSAVFTRRTRGPIGGVRIVPTSETQGFVELFSSGAVISTPACGSVASGAPAWRAIGVGAIPLESEGGGASIEFVTACGLDNCGSPDPIFPPPININIEPEITFEGDDGTEITIDIPFTFSPITVNLDGSLRIPFTFDVGGFNFNGDLNISPTLPVTINLPTLPRGSGQGTETQPPDQPGESTNPLTAQEKIIGVVVTATTIQQDKVSSYSSPGIPEIYVPRLGSVKFVYNLGGATFFSSDIDIKDRRTFIECPFAGGADAVIASPQIGVDFSFLPIRGFPLATIGDLARLP